MATLMSKSRNQKVLHELRTAASLWSRTRGLLGTPSLPTGHGLWILRCNSIHTFFMNYPIDCIFLDRHMKVVALDENVKPGRLLWPRWGADSVVEIAGGQLSTLSLQLGEELYVGD